MEYAEAKNISLPLQFDDTPSTLESRTTAAVDDFFAVVDGLVKIPREKATFDSAVLPFIRAENHFLRVQRHIGFYSGQSPNKELRKVSNKVSKQFADAENQLSHRRDFYQLLKHILDTEDHLDDDYEYWLKNFVSNYENSGLAFEDDVKVERHAALAKRRRDITSEIIKNLNDEKGGVWFTEEELAGVPAEFIESHRRERNGHEADIWVTFANPDLVAVDSAESSETRKRLSLADGNKVPENVELYRELFLVRDESARLLGYDNYASYSTKFQELGALDKVEAFLDAIEARAKAPAERDIAAMLKIKEKWLTERGEPNPHPGTLFRWENSFYMGKLKNLEAGIDYTRLDEYFPLDHCLQKCLEYFHHLFGVRAELVEASDTDVWHEEVSMYALWDDDNAAFLGWLYLDFFPREGKYSHFGHYGLQPVGLAPTGSSLLTPSSALVANFARGTATTPPLLPASVAKRLFHELGHSMHGALARTRCAQQHLIVGRYMVYSEAVSMVFEQFLWTPRHMRECSLHYSHLSDEYARAWRAANPGKELPPRELPEATIAATLAARKRSAAIHVRSQIMLARWDLAAHGPPSREAMLNMDLASVYNKIRVEVTGMSGEEVETGRFDGTHGFATKRLIAGGYAAYYYCYIFSQVWAHDLFAVGFKGATMDAERGRRYRRIVLERGLGMAPMDIMREFLGREPNDTAYFEAHEM